MTDAGHYSVATTGVAESFQVGSDLVSLHSLSIPSVILHSVLVVATGPTKPQSQPSNSTKAVLGNQTSASLEPSGTMTA